MNKVSVIMPCYNCEKYVEESILSVLRQTHLNLELLICDDGSTDRSLEIIENYLSKDSRIKVFSNVYSKGAPGARNTCLDHVSGDFVSFLDADDLWMEDKLERHLNFMLENDVAFSYSHLNIMNDTGEFICVIESPHEVNAKKMRFANFIPCPTAIYNVSVVGHIHQPNIKKRNDFALWLKILNGGAVDKAICFKEVTSSYRTNSYGLSSNRIDAARYYYKCLTDYNNCSKIGALFFLSVYVTLVGLKKKFPSIYNKIVVRVF